jgi:hypothetical protein
MLRYDHLKDHPRDFLAATGLTLAEFALLLPAFEAAYDDLYPPHLTAAGQARQRQRGGGAIGGLTMPDGIFIPSETFPVGRWRHR